MNKATLYINKHGNNNNSNGKRYYEIGFASIYICIYIYSNVRLEFSLLCFVIVIASIDAAFVAGDGTIGCSIVVVLDFGFGVDVRVRMIMIMIMIIMIVGIVVGIIGKSGIRMSGRIISDSRRTRRRRSILHLLLTSRKGQNTSLKRVVARARIHGDVVGEWLAAAKVLYAVPCLLFAAQFGLHPGEGDEGPDCGPCEGEGPAQLRFVSYFPEEREKSRKDALCRQHPLTL